MSEKVVTREDWEIREDNDDESIASEVTEVQDDDLFSSEDLVTEIDVFPKTGKPYLTLVGLFSMANREHIQITDKSIEETDMSYKVLFEGKNQEGDIRYGAHEEFKGSNSTHAYAKAISKAQRNLFKAFLYGNPLVKEAFAKFTLGQEQAKQVFHPPDAKKEEESNEGDADRLRKRCFALYSEHKDVLEAAAAADGIEFWQAVRNRFGVKSRATMELRHWRGCLTMITDFINAAEDAKKKAEDAKNE